jgi:hypothetical protein
MGGAISIVVNERLYKHKKGKVVQVYNGLGVVKDKQEGYRRHLSKRKLKKRFIKRILVVGKGSRKQLEPSLIFNLNN